MNLQTALQALELCKIDHREEIHDAYRRLVKRWHPDQFVRRPEIQSMAEERLKQINQAYSVLNEYFKKVHINSQNSNEKKDTCKHSKDQFKGDAPGKDHWVMDWLRKTFGKKACAPQGSRSGAARRRRSMVAAGMGRSGVDGILRQPRHTRKRRFYDALSSTRRPRPAVHYRRRSAHTRIEGARTVSPVHPVRPVPRIDPIEGSE